MQSRFEQAAVSFLRGLARELVRRPRWFVYPQIVLFIGSILYTAGFLQFSTNRDDLVGADKEYHRNFIRYKSDFRAEEELVAVAESDSPEKNRQFVERLGVRLLGETNLFTDVMYQTDVKMLGNKALLFFPEEELEQLESTLRDFSPFLEQFTSATNLTSMMRLVNQRFRSAFRDRGAEGGEEMVKALPAFRRIIEEATVALDRPGNPPSPGVTALFGAGPEAEQRIYITFDAGRLYVVTARPISREVKGAAVARLRELVEETRREVTGVNASITGEPVLEMDEMAQSQRDTTKAAVVSLMLVALIFIYGYRESGRPLKATVCLVVGLAYTMAFATLSVGHLNILTITFVPMLIGLAIDFGVHLVTRYEEELRHGLSEARAIEQALVHTGRGIFTGCLTTAGAFFAMGLTDFRGSEEMGVICGGGLVICLVPMMTLLPVMVMRGRQNVLDHEHPLEESSRARLERMWLARPWTVLGVAFGVSLLAWVGARGVPFDYNLLNLQSRDLPAVVLEKKLITTAEKSVLYCAVVTDSLEEAVRLEERLKGGDQKTVATADSMAIYLAEDPSAKLERIGRIKSLLAPLQFPVLDAGPVGLSELSAVLWSLQGYLGLGVQYAREEGADEAVVGEMVALREAIGGLRKRMLSGSRVLNAAKLGSYQRALLGDVELTLKSIRDQDDSSGMGVEDLPKVLRLRFVSYGGDRHLVKVYPRFNVWEREYQEAFVRELRETLDPEGTGRPVITGTPVQLLEYTSLLKDSYVEAAWYALGAIALLVLVYFRSLVCVVLALVPVGLGTLWMAGCMGWWGIPFNPANIMTLPLVIGIGVTSGIHMLTRCAEEGSASLLAKSTGKAVLVSALTTIAGFGSLMLGQHQGIASLGIVMATGTATCMIAALTVLPAMLKVLGGVGWTMKGKTQWQRREPVTGLGGTEVKTSTALEN